MKKKPSIIILFFSFLLINFSFFAQNSTDSSYTNNSLNLKLNATALVDFAAFPTLELSLEKRFKNYYGLQGEIGIQLYSENNIEFDTTFVSKNGLRLRLEGRFYISDYINYKENKSVNTKFGFFTGLNILYRKNSYNSTYYYYPNNSSIFIKDNIGVKKSVYGLNLLFGSQFYLSDKIFIEPTAYFGFIERNIQNIDRDTPKEKGLEGSLMARGYKDLRESSGTTLNISFAIRVGINL